MLCYVQAACSLILSNIIRCNQCIFHSSVRRHSSLTLSTFTSFLYLTAFRLYSLWYVGYLLDDFYDLQVRSCANFLMYKSACRPDSIEPPRLFGSMPSYFLSLLYCISQLFSILHRPFDFFIPLSNRPTSHGSLGASTALNQRGF